MSVEALKMGEYGVYVWSCYGMTVLALLWMFFSARNECQRELQHARRRAQAAAVDQASSPESPS